jgi:hypothetical protein
LLGVADDFQARFAPNPEQVTLHGVQVRHQLVFDRAERTLIEDMLIHMTILDERWHERDSRGTRQHPGRVLSALIAGQPASREQLGVAREILIALEDICRVQSDPGHWRRELAPPASIREAKTPSEPSAVGLIAPGTDVSAVLAESRQQALGHVQAARELIDQALALLPIDPEPPAAV